MVDFMGLKGISHRDLNPYKLLIHHDHSDLFKIFLGDFSKAVMLCDCEAKPFSLKDPRSGRPGYIAPEILQGKQPNLKSDIFSVGAILYNIIMRKELFKGSDLKVKL
jgi:serine/threonine protein kinase